MKKPSVFVNKIDKKLKNNESVFASYDREKPETMPDSNNVRQKIKDIFASPNYVYKADVRIKTSHGVLNKKIVGMNGDRLLTMDNDFININDIRNIEIQK